jgi:hypothetical protein
MAVVAMLLDAGAKRQHVVGAAVHGGQSRTVGAGKHSNGATRNQQHNTTTRSSEEHDGNAWGDDDATAAATTRNGRDNATLARARSAGAEMLRLSTPLSPGDCQVRCLLLLDRVTI